MSSRLLHLGRNRGGRRISLAWLALALLALTATGAAAAPAGFSDPADVPTALDLKTVSHADESGTIVYIAETYEGFASGTANFKWDLDTNGDGLIDLIVTAEFDDGALRGRVENRNEDTVATGAVSRPAGPSGNSIRVAFPASVLGSIASYQYRVRAVTDEDDDGEDDPGEVDLAPNAGFYRHVLGAPASTPVPSAGTAAPGATSAPAGTQGDAAGTQGASAGPGAATTPAPSASVEAARSSRQPPQSGQQPQQQEGPGEALPRTGPVDPALALLGIGCVVMGWGMTALAAGHPATGHVPSGRLPRLRRGSPAARRGRRSIRRPKAETPTI